MKKKKLSICLIAALLLFVCACGNEERKASVLYISEKYGVPDENRLVVYTSHKEEVYLPIVREFESVTGVSVTVHAGGTAELFDEIRSGDAVGKCDVMFGGGIESYEAAKDCFMAYSPAERDVLDPGFTSDGDYWTPFTELPLVFVYNRKLMASSEAPVSWAELMDEKWKGRIAFADPHNSGTSYTIISTYMQIMGKSPKEAVTEFYTQLNGKVLSSSRDIVPYVSDGTYLVGITLEETAKKTIQEGYDIAMIYPSDGTSAVPDGCGIVKNAPHSYNAGRFIDFVIGRETQNYAIENFKRRTVRTDIELPAEFSEIKRIDFDIRRSAENEAKVFEIWDSLAGGGKP